MDLWGLHLLEAGFKEKVSKSLTEQKFSEALSFVKSNYSKTRASSGLYHPKSISVLIAWGKIHFHAKQYAEAIPKLIRARSICERAFGASHYLYGLATYALAQVYVSQDLVAEGEVAFKQAIQILDGCEVASVRAQGGLMLAQFGELKAVNDKPKEAREFFDRALAAWDLDPQNIPKREYFTVKLRVGLLAHSEEAFDDAHFQLGQVFSSENAAGVSQISKDLVRRGLEVLIEICALRGNMEDELKYLSLLGDIYQKLSPIPYDKLLELLEKRGQIQRSSNMLEDARANYKRMAELLSGPLKDTGSLDQRGEVQLVIGELCFVIGDKSEAFNALDQARQLFQTSGAKPQSTALALHNLGTLLLTEGDIEKAGAYFTDALKLREQVYGQEHPEVADTLYALGVLFRNKQQPEQALPYLSRALGIRRSVLDKEDELLLVTEKVFEQSRAEAQQKISAATEAAVAQAAPKSEEPTEIVEIASPLTESSDSGIPREISKIGKIFSDGVTHLNSGDAVEALKLFGEVLKMLEKNSHEHHPDLVPVLEHIAQSYDQLGFVPQAAVFRRRAEQIKSGVSATN